MVWLSGNSNQTSHNVLSNQAAVLVEYIRTVSICTGKTRLAPSLPLDSFETGLFSKGFLSGKAGGRAKNREGRVRLVLLAAFRILFFHLARKLIDRCGIKRLSASGLPYTCRFHCVSWRTKKQPQRKFIIAWIYIYIYTYVVYIYIYPSSKNTICVQCCVSVVKADVRRSCLRARRWKKLRLL